MISGNVGQSVFTFNKTMALGNSSSLNLYNLIVQVSNLTIEGALLPSTISVGAAQTLNIGDTITLTNTGDTTTNNIFFVKSEYVYLDVVYLEQCYNKEQFDKIYCISQLEHMPHHIVE